MRKPSFHAIRAIAPLIALTGISQGCSSSSDSSTTATAATSAGRSVTVKAGGISSSLAAGARQKIARNVLNQASVSVPAGDEYAGMGVNFGDAVVDGLKIHMTGIDIGTGGFGLTG